MRRIILLAGIVGLVLAGGCATFWSKDYGVDVLTINPDGAAAALQKAITKSGNAGFIVIAGNWLPVLYTYTPFPPDAALAGACNGGTST